jgi:hypothetical protein
MGNARLGSLGSLGTMANLTMLHRLTDAGIVILK